MYNIHYMTHFPLTALCDGVGVDALLLPTVTLSINVVSNKRVSPCEVGQMRGGAEKREVKRDEGGEGGKMARREERWGGEGIARMGGNRVKKWTVKS